MRQTRAKLPALLTSLFLLAVAAHAQSDERSRTPAPGAPEISYTVSTPRPHTHMLEVEARLRYTSAPASVELRMPVWTPGSNSRTRYEPGVQTAMRRSTDAGADV